VAKNQYGQEEAFDGKLQHRHHVGLGELRQAARALEGIVHRAVQSEPMYLVPRTASTKAADHILPGMNFDLQAADAQVPRAHKALPYAQPWLPSPQLHMLELLMTLHPPTCYRCCKVAGQFRPHQKREIVRQSRQGRCHASALGLTRMPP
jgi:hypothetical protein